MAKETVKSTVVGDSDTPVETPILDTPVQEEVLPPVVEEEVKGESILTVPEQDPQIIMEGNPDSFPNYEITEVGINEQQQHVYFNLASYRHRNGIGIKALRWYPARTDLPYSLKLVNATTNAVETYATRGEAVARFNEFRL